MGKSLAPVLKQFGWFIIIAAIFLAALPYFGNDIANMVIWFFNKVWEIISGLAEKISSIEAFRNIFS